MTTEQELLDQLSEAEEELRFAKRDLAAVKKHWTECETIVIERKLIRDRISEALHSFRMTTYAPEIEERDEEISDFRTRFPDICRLAEQRDLDKLKGD